MAISIEVNEISDPEIRGEIKWVIRDCIGDRPKDEDWKVWIRGLSGQCEITLKGPIQTRKRLFFDDTRALPEKVRAWFEAYPLR